MFRLAVQGKLDYYEPMRAKSNKQRLMWMIVWWLGVRFIGNLLPPFPDSWLRPVILTLAVLTVVVPAVMLWQEWKRMPR